MSETLRTLPKNSPIRLRVAEQVQYARQLDKSKNYVTTRKLHNYIDSFAGITALLDHIKSINSEGTVLDIGAGEALALSQLSESEIGKELNYMGTVLTPPSEKPDLKVINTTAENLFDIPDDSITGIISCYGLAYSAAPEYVARRIDEVLVAGGPVKATFYGKIPSPGDFVDYHGLQDAGRFLSELRKLEYDIATQKHMAGEIVLAIKPGGNPAITAVDLLSQDEKLYRESPTL